MGTWTFENDFKVHSAGSGAYLLTEHGNLKPRNEISPRPNRLALERGTRPKSPQGGIKAHLADP